MKINYIGKKVKFNSNENNFKKDLIELLLNWELKFLEDYLDMDLTEKQYDNFDVSVRNVYSKLWYNFKWKLIYSDDDIDNLLYELNLKTFSFWDYLLYFTFKTEDEWLWYFYISLLEWTILLNNEDIVFSNKNEFYKFIRKYIIEDFFTKIKWLKEIQVFVWKNETMRPTNNTNRELNKLVA